MQPGDFDALHYIQSMSSVNASKSAMFIRWSELMDNFKILIAWFWFRVSRFTHSHSLAHIEVNQLLAVNKMNKKYNKRRPIRMILKIKAAVELFLWHTAEEEQIIIQISRSSALSHQWLLFIELLFDFL